jgi:hypothetical protein
MKYVEEFLYRGRPPGSEDPPAWHVNIADSDTPREPPVQYNMAAATAIGWTLPMILSEINAKAIVELAATQEALAKAQTDLAAEQERAETLTQQVTEAQQRVFQMQAILVAGSSAQATITTGIAGSDTQ